MPRTVELNLPFDRSEQLVRELAEFEGVISLRRQPGAFVRPPGDLVVVSILDRSFHTLARYLIERGIGQEAGSITTSVPLGVIDARRQADLARDTSEVGWEEMEALIGRDSNMLINMLLMMAIAGAIATAGLATSAVHLVIAGMLITPGFEPLTRISLGVVSQSRAWRDGLIDTLKGYAALAFGAALSASVLRVAGVDVFPGPGSYLEQAVLTEYWTSWNPSSVLIVIVAGIGGAILIASNRSIATTGVMVAVALVPSASLVGIALVAFDVPVLATGALRWAFEAAVIVAGGSLVFAWKRVRLHRRVAVAPSRG